MRDSLYPVVYLVEYGPQTTDEGPHPRPYEALRVHVRVAHVEHAAAVGHVRIKAVLQSVAAADTRYNSVVGHNNRGTHTLFVLIWGSGTTGSPHIYVSVA